MNPPEKTCIVTGASAGIGFAISKTFARANYGVIGIGRNTSKLEGLSNAYPSNFLGCPFDVNDDEALDRFLRKFDANNEKLSALILCAGVHHLGDIATAPVSEFDAMYRINVRAPYRLIQSLLPNLRAAHGDVVFLNSSISQHVREKTAAFSATQQALKAVADTLRQEENRNGIRVLTVFPGRTATPRTRNVFSDEGRSYDPSKMLQPDDIARMILASVNLPNTAELTDLHIRPAIKSY